MKNERAFLIIDGSNLYHRLKEAFGVNSRLLNFDYRNFTEWLIGNRSAASKNYYIGVVRAAPDDQKGQAMRKNQQQLFTRLGKAGIKVVRGYLLNVGDNHHEKGVDVHMATDILIGAYENLLVTDNDLRQFLSEDQATTHL